MSLRLIKKRFSQLAEPFDFIEKAQAFKKEKIGV